jgi:hypothetical protein
MMDHLSQYLKAIMSDVILSNAQLLNARVALRHAKSTNGLTSVKLHKIRQRLELEATPIIAAYAEIDERYALHVDGKPVIKKDENGKDLSWIATGTPAYEPDGAKASERASEMKALESSTLNISVPLLGELDLGWITSEADIGASLDLFTDVSAAA